LPAGSIAGDHPAMPPMPRKLRVTLENGDVQWVVAWGAHPLHGLIAPDEQKADDGVEALTRWAKAKSDGWLEDENKIIAVVLDVW